MCSTPKMLPTQYSRKRSSSFLASMSAIMKAIRRSGTPTVSGCPGTRWVGRSGHSVSWPASSRAKVAWCCRTRRSSCCRGYRPRIACTSDRGRLCLRLRATYLLPTRRNQARRPRRRSSTPPWRMPRKMKTRRLRSMCPRIFSSTRWRKEASGTFRRNGPDQLASVPGALHKTFLAPLPRAMLVRRLRDIPRARRV
jgi:hypothetical protein